MIFLLPLFLCAGTFPEVLAAPRNVTIDDIDSAFQYSTSPQWDTIIWAQQSPQPLNGTNHGSPNPGAVVTFNFTGTAIYFYGYKWNDHGFRTITVDNTRTVQCDGRQGEQGSRALIFSRGNLANTEHTVVIENIGTQGQYLNIDYAVITQANLNSSVSSGNSATSSLSAPTSTSTQNTSSSDKNYGFPIAAVAGGAGGALAVGLLILIAFLLLRSKRNRVRQERRYSDTSMQNFNQKPSVSAGSPAVYTPVATPQMLPPQQFPRHQHMTSVASFQPAYSDIEGYIPHDTQSARRVHRPIASQSYPESPSFIPQAAPSRSMTMYSSTPSTPSTGLVQLGYTEVQRNHYTHHSSEKERRADGQPTSQLPIAGSYSATAGQSSGSVQGNRDSGVAPPPEYSLTP